MAEALVIPQDLRTARRTSTWGRAWLEQLPDLVERACERWNLSVAGPPFAGGTCAWVAPVSGCWGADAVLKISWPHEEARREPDALRYWAGAGAVRLLADDVDDWALLLERCRPGVPLRDAGLPAEEGLGLAADLLAALWDRGPSPEDDGRFEVLALVCATWADLAASRIDRYGSELAALGADPAILRLGVELLRELPGSANRRVLLHGDANPGNFLAARREPFLAIDPKPMLGDPAYDLWPLLAQLGWPPGDSRVDAGRLLHQRIRLLAARLSLPAERIAAWGVARDVEGGLWAASEGDVTAGATWIRNGSLAAPLLG